MDHQIERNAGRNLVTKLSDGKTAEYSSGVRATKLYSLREYDRDVFIDGRKESSFLYQESDMTTINISCDVILNGTNETTNLGSNSQKTCYRISNKEDSLYSSETDSSQGGSSEADNNCSRRNSADSLECESDNQSEKSTGHTINLEFEENMFLITDMYSVKRNKKDLFITGEVISETTDTEKFDERFSEECLGTSGVFGDMNVNRDRSDPGRQKNKMLPNVIAEDFKMHNDHLDKNIPYIDEAYSENECRAEDCKGNESLQTKSKLLDTGRRNTEGKLSILTAVENTSNILLSCESKKSESKENCADQKVKQCIPENDRTGNCTISVTKMSALNENDCNVFIDGMLMSSDHEDHERCVTFCIPENNSLPEITSLSEDKIQEHGISSSLDHGSDQINDDECSGTSVDSSLNDNTKKRMSNVDNHNISEGYDGLRRDFAITPETIKENMSTSGSSLQQDSQEDNNLQTYERHGSNSSIEDLDAATEKPNLSMVSPASKDMTYARTVNYTTFSDSGYFPDDTVNGSAYENVQPEDKTAFQLLNNEPSARCGMICITGDVNSKEKQEHYNPGIDSDDDANVKEKQEYHVRNDSDKYLDDQSLQEKQELPSRKDTDQHTDDGRQTNPCKLGDLATATSRKAKSEESTEGRNTTHRKSTNCKFFAMIILFGIILFTVFIILFIYRLDRHICFDVILTYPNGPVPT